MRVLKEHYVLVHVHANNHVGTGNEGLTDCMELTWVRKDFVPSNLDLRRKFYIDGLDFSNVHGQEDLRYCF